MDSYRWTYSLLLWTIISIHTFAEKTVRIEENESGSIICPERNVVHIVSASYNGQAMFCDAHDVTSIVRDLCQDTQTCTLHAVDETYKDTCRGPNEMLFVKYECHEDCLYVNKGKIFYNGTRHHTKSGKTCQWWDYNEPHKPMYRPKKGGQRNYCRNPDEDKQLWCYTTDPGTRWEYCDIEHCDSSSFIPTTPTLQSIENDNKSEEGDTPVAIILGVLFGVLVTSVVIVAVFIVYKRRKAHMSETTSKEQRRAYIYSAPENDNTLMGRVRRLLKGNTKQTEEGGALANNPGYSAMQGEKIESIDYANDVLLKTRVYEMPNTTNDKMLKTRVYEVPNTTNNAHNQLYTSLYDTPTANSTGEDLDTSYENQYEEPEPPVKSTKPVVAIKPMIRKPQPSPKLPKSCPTPPPKPDNDNQNIKSQDTSRQKETSDDSNFITTSDDQPKEGLSMIKDKINITDNRIGQSNSTASLVKSQIEKFNKS